MSTIATKFCQLEIEDGGHRYHQDISMQFFGFPQLFNQNTPNTSDRRSSYLNSPLKTRITPVSEYSDLILSVLPPRELTDALVKGYFTVIPFNRFLVNKDSFYIEYDKFWSASAIDPFFLALLFAMVSMPTEISKEEARTADGRQKSYKKRLSDASTECLKRGKYMKHYCLKGLQAMLLNQFNFWLNSKGIDFPASIAHGLGLHRDPTNINGLEESEFEFRRRLWCVVLIFDVHFSWLEGLPLHVVPAETDTLAPTYSPHVDGDTDTARKHFKYTILLYHVLQVWASIHQSTRALKPPGYEKVQHTQHYIWQVDSAAAQLLKIDENEPDAWILWEACSMESAICRAQLTLHLSHISTHPESKQLALNAAIRSLRCFFTINGHRSEDLETYKWRGYWWMIRGVLIATLLSALLVTSEKLPEEEEVWELIHGTHEILRLEEMKCHLGRDIRILDVIERLRLDRLVNYDLIKDIEWEWVQSFQ
ncbi:putative transcriptional regulatory protein [Neolecta irregularis DAH-3]|uniref:Putative transcriptional regulatory protein n=1 Tax=Neolecta irregularis (strain DAH-3) TaxID=1198029 RepID=A0A1U7LJ28_NEOID|nr:putative transcriptional regulatory protein [Neolecta irregularis DAH-3]|eukprot:OLL22649.1 putative transcriptional regulatory protein [Neolecta irregularis DAH-3]